ncbi:MAG: eukaryotic-like serine/threonine-protein kinase [Actinomycetota bacterium]
MTPIPQVPHAETTLRAGQELVGRYRLVRLIDRGGMAEVWEAHDTVLARPVALKALHAHLASDGNFQARFRREAVAAARLAHTNVVATFDSAADGDVIFIVMELIRGRSLRAVLDDRGTLPPAEATNVAVQVGRALAHAHRAGLVHRDVKPGNILLCDEPGRLGQVKVTDFGIAKAALDEAGDITETGAVVGTARYIAPEQAQGGAPDPRTDIYSLGVVLYEMLSGEPPFSGPTELATALMHVEADPPRLRRRRAGIPRALEAVVLKAMSKDPGGRFADAGELVAALEAIDLGADDADPFVVREPTPPGGVPVLARRARRSVIPLVVLVVAAAAGIALAAMLGRGGDGTPGDGGTATPGQAVTIASATSFDPDGPDNAENEDQVPRLRDGRQDTTWATDRYRARTFGTKPGVGVVLKLDRTHRLGKLRVDSPTQGWAARVYVADAEGATLRDWGASAASAENINGGATFDLQGRQGAAVLIWITDTGTAHKAEIAEVQLTS